MLALTESPVQAGLIAATQQVPFVVLGLPAGALLDRWNRKAVMLACDTARLIAFGSVPAAWALGGLTLTHLYAVALVHGTALVFFNIAQLAALPRVVPREQLAEAHSLNTGSEGIGTLVGPGIGGLLIGLAPAVAAGAALAYLVDAVSYAVSLVTLVTIRTPFQTPRVSPPLRQMHRQILEGWRWIWERRDLRWLMPVNTLHRTAFAPVQLAVVLLGTQRLHLEPAGLGLLFSAAGAGGLAASLFTAPLRRVVSVGHCMVGLTAVHGASLLVVALAPSAGVAAVGLFAAGAMENMTGIVQVSYRLSVIPDGLQGRVNSSYRFVSYFGTTIGTAIGGVLLATLSASSVLALIAGVIGVISVMAAATPVRRL